MYSQYFSHCLLTRFNIRFNETAPPTPDSWLRHRLDLFRRGPLRSVKSQTVRPDVWLVLCDARSPGWFRQEISAVVEDIGDLVWSEEPFSSAVVAREIASRMKDQTHLITTRLDNDDCISRDFLSIVQSKFEGQDFEFLNLTHGGQWKDGRFYYRSDPSNAFCTLVERLTARGPRTVFLDCHHLLHQYGTVRQIKTHPAWIQIIHDHNLANRVSGVRAQPESILRYFDVDLPVRRTGRISLFADSVISAATLLSRIVRSPARMKHLAPVLFSATRTTKSLKGREINER